MQSGLKHRAIWVLAAISGGAAARFGSDVLMSRLLGPEGKGYFALFLSTSMVMAAILGLGLPSAITYFAARHPAWLDRLHRLSLGYAGLGALVMLIATALWTVLDSHPAIGVTLLPPWYIWAMGLMIPLVLYIQLGRSLLLGMDRIRMYGSILLIQFGGLFLILVFRQPTDYRAVIGWLMGVTILSVIVLWVCIRVLPGERAPEPFTLRPVAIFAWRCAIGNVFQLLTYRFDVLILAYFVQPTALGIYSVAVLLGEGIWLLGDAISTVLMPMMARDRESVDLARALRVTWFLTLVAVVAVAFSGPLIGWIFGPRFQSTREVFLWLAPGVLAIAVQKVLSAIFAGEGKPLVGSLAAVYSFLATIALDPWVIPRWGIVGAAAVSSVSYLVGAGYLVIRHAREHPEDRAFFLRSLNLRAEMRLLLPHPERNGGAL